MSDCDNCRNDYRELFSNYIALEEENNELKKQLEDCKDYISILLLMMIEMKKGVVR